MNKTSEGKYFRGRIKEYDNKRGRGLIWPDDGEEIVGQLLLRRKSLRDSNIQLAFNERVLFSIETTDRGLLAIDVHPEKVEHTEPPERTQGTIIKLSNDRRAGNLRLIN